MDTATKEPATVGDIVDQLPAIVEPRTVTPMQLLQSAVEKGATVEQLAGLLALQERWEANDARKAFVAALSAFKADPPTIIKNKRAGFDSKRTGERTDYEFATLDMVAAVIGEALSRHGLSHRWETKQAEGKISVTCVLMHRLGHSERVTLEAGADASGSKNSIQAIGSTVTYLERYTLLAATGLAAKGQDNDTKNIGADDGATISPEQKAKLVSLMQEAEPDAEKLGARTKRFLKFFKVDTLDNLPANRFTEARDILQSQANAAKTPVTP